jgi:hypothetical protein
MGNSNLLLNLQKSTEKVQFIIRSTNSLGYYRLIEVYQIENVMGVEDCT